MRKNRLTNQAQSHRIRLLQLLADNKDRGVGVRASVKNDAATIYLYDVIDPFWGVSAIAFAAALNQVRNADSITLRINSPGGDVFEGRSIASLLSDVADRLTVQVDGLAASAATTVAIQGKNLIMMPGSFFMIHKAWTFAMGNDDELTALAKLLGKIDGELSAEYAQVSGKSVEETLRLMAEETWFTAQEAVDAGFADSVAGAAADDDEQVIPDKDEDATQDRAAWNLSAYARAPKLAIASARRPKIAADVSRETNPRDSAARALRLREINFA